MRVQDPTDCPMSGVFQSVPDRAIEANILKNRIKSILKSSGPYKKVSEHFRIGTIDRYEFIRGFMTGNAWLFSQPKSGTNLICSTIAFYNAERLGISNYSFKDRYRLGLIHGARINSETIENFNEFRLRSCAPVFIRTHDDIYGGKPRYLVNVTRNVLDNLVSVYHFTWQPRGLSVDDALAPMVKEFASIHIAQKNACSRAENSILLRYENLKQNPTEAFANLFEFAFGEIDHKALAIALAAGTPERFKAWEESAGAFIPEPTKKFQKSFIRSGKIGEGSEFFSDKQKDNIVSILESTGIMNDHDVVL